MIVYHKNQGYKLTIASWAMAADDLGVELYDFDKVDSDELKWSIIVNAARYHDAMKGIYFSNRKAKRIKKRLYKEQLKKSLGGGKKQTGLEKLTKALEDSAADIKKKGLDTENQ